MNYLVEYVTGLTMLAGPPGSGLLATPSPIHAAIDSKGLAAFRPSSDIEAETISAGDWEAIESEVQGPLSKLTARVLEQEPGAIWKSGRTAARAFALFTYRVFNRLDGEDEDPVVVGVTFSIRGAKVRIAGDISGDESGSIYYDEGCLLDVPAEPASVKRAARAVADRLASQDAILIESLRSRDSQVSAG